MPRILAACLGLLFLIGSVRRRRADWLHWTLLACAALYFSNPFLARSALLSRYLIYVALALQWAVVRWLAEDEAGFLRPRARVLLFFLVFEPSAVFETRALLALSQPP